MERERKCKCGGTIHIVADDHDSYLPNACIECRKKRMVSLPASSVGLDMDGNVVWRNEPQWLKETP